MFPRCFIVLLLTLLSCSVAISQNPASENVKKEARLLKQKIQASHVNPRELDDDFSVWVFQRFLEELDPNRLHFTADDLKTIAKYKTQIDDELNGNSWAFLNEASALYKNCLRRSEKYLEEILQKPFTWDKAEPPLQLNNLQWAANDQEQRLHWTRWLKYKTLDRLYLSALQQTAPAGTAFLSVHEADARKKVLQSETANIQRVLNNPAGFESNVASAFFTAVASSFDPHTSYFTATRLLDFLHSLSSEGLSLGFVLNENEKGEVTISYLVPGGPAWKSGELNISDVLVQLRWDESEIVDLYGLGIDKIGELLNEGDQGILELTVRKTSGIQKTVRLRKEKMELEENVVRSFILKGEKTIGYISLPGFYSDWGSENKGSRSASDVAKEIVKLNREKIDGLILDIRNNGGGSLKEAIEMAGIFIDHGPLGVLRDRAGALTTLKDVNRGTIYNGPLALMVNRQSASASEHLAGVLQDYNRAILVGSRTFGKATAQNIVSLDPGNKDITEISDESLGYASITLSRIYRVTGTTAQGNGVIPDVILPDVLDSLDIFEASLPLALAPDSIEKNAYYRPLPPLPLKMLREESACRVDTSDFFRRLKEFSAWLPHHTMEKKQIPLTWPAYTKTLAERIEKYSDAEAQMSAYTVSFSILNHESDVNRMQIDAFMKYVNERWIKNLSTDIYLDEAFHILCDYIKHNRQ